MIYGIRGHARAQASQKMKIRKQGKTTKEEVVDQENDCKEVCDESNACYRNSCHNRCQCQECPHIYHFPPLNSAIFPSHYVTHEPSWRPGSRLLYQHCQSIPIMNPGCYEYRPSLMCMEYPCVDPCVYNTVQAANCRPLSFMTPICL